MAEVDAAAPSAAKPASVKKTSSKPKKPAAHPPFAAMITEAIKALKERTGSSRQAILKHICANNSVDLAVAQLRVRIALKKMVEDKKLIPGGQPGKKGAGCYKLGVVEKPKAAKKAPTKKPAAKKVKSPAKKAASKAKKPAAKKSAAKKGQTPVKKAAAKKASKPAAKAKSSTPKTKVQKKSAKPKDVKAKKAAKPKSAKPKAAGKAKKTKAAA